jgi:DNA-binding NarL/FixJ family response regulator
VSVSLSPFKSLRVRLITSVVIIEIVMLSLLVWSNLAVIRQAHADRLWDTATGLLEQVATTSGVYLIEVDYASLEEYLRNFTHQQELAYLMVLDRDNQPVVTLGSLPQVLWPTSDSHPLSVDDGILDLERAILIGNKVMGEVHAGFSLAQMEQAINSARVRSIAIAGTEITLTILATVFIGMHLTRRLGRLADAAQRVGSGDYAVSVPAELNDEVGMTAMAFNRMVNEVSPREFEVFRLRAEGLSVNDIAELLNVSPKTIGHHNTSLKQKLGAANDAELTRLAIRLGVITP